MTFFCYVMAAGMLVISRHYNGRKQTAGCGERTAGQQPIDAAEGAAFPCRGGTSRRK
jgi:hypothetical protein